MMRRVLSCLAVLAACASPARDPRPREAEVGPRYLTIGADAIDTARAVATEHGVAALEVLAADGEAAVIAFPGEHLDELSAQMHERHGRCGGFMVHESADAAWAALQIADDRGARPAIDYTLDREAAVRAVLPHVDPARILGTIRELSAMQNRYYRSATGAAASTWLAARWRSFTTRPDVTVELVDHGYPQQSVILTIPGTTRASEVVVIGGHLDSIARGGLSSTAPGADDDASGIATLTEVARVLLANDVRPARTLKFMAYAAEEVGLRGSLSIARDFKRRGVDVVGALQLDMTNYQGSDRDIWLMKDFTSAAQNEFLVRLIETYVGATWGLDACGYACSDHASWHRAGVPASMPFEARMRDRNGSIHTAEDTLEISHENALHASKFARLGAAYAIELGKAELAEPRAARAHEPGPSRRRGVGLLALALAVALGLMTRSRVVGRPTGP